MFRRIVRFRVICFMTVFGLTVLGTAGTSIAQDKTLYQRLGGYDAVSAVVDEFADRLFAMRN
jgi:hypothetical protein